MLFTRDKPMTQRLKVLLLIPHLGGGGAEQVTALLARNISRRKYELHLALVTQISTGVQSLPQGVSIHALNSSRVRTGALRLLRLVRSLKPDVILSGMAHLNFLVLLLRPFFPRSTHVLVRQNTTASDTPLTANHPSVTRLLYRWLYRRADCVICQTPAMASDLRANFGVPQQKLLVLPNPVDAATIRATVDASPSPWANLRPASAGPHLLAVGRLSREKGFDLLLGAIVIVRKRFPDAELVIAGSGPEEIALKKLCHDTELDSAVRFAGYIYRPSDYFSGASLFVLSSRHEGLPNALLEAAASGLPLVVTPASEGMTDLLRNQPGVWLAKEITAEALAIALLTALIVLRPGQRFPHAFVDPFSLDRAIPAYEALIDATFKESQQ
jgi:glycosyltransferase involved in cell wall biosynthesis